MFLVSGVSDSKCYLADERLEKVFPECDNKLITQFCEIMI